MSLLGTESKNWSSFKWCIVQSRCFCSTKVWYRDNPSLWLKGLRSYFARAQRNIAKKVKLQLSSYIAPLVAIGGSSGQDQTTCCLMGHMNTDSVTGLKFGSWSRNYDLGDLVCGLVQEQGRAAPCSNASLFLKYKPTLSWQLLAKLTQILAV